MRMVVPLALLVLATSACATGSEAPEPSVRSAPSADPIVRSAHAPSPRFAGGSVQGSVVRADGGPVEGARVWITYPANPEMPRPLDRATDATGRFLFERLPGAKYEFLIRAPGLASRYVRAEPGDDVRITLGPQRRLAGRLVGATGRPAANAVVYVDLAEQGRRNATSDADGRFVVEDLGDDAGTLVAVVREGSPDASSKRVLRVGGVRASEDVREFAMASGPPIEGIVVDAKGRPVRHLGVQAIPHEFSGADYEFDACAGQSGPDGRFRIDGLTPGRYDLRVWYGDGGYTTHGPARSLTGGDDVAAGAREVRLTYDSKEAREDAKAAGGR